MRDERTRRRPGFRSGLELRLADGQVWSLPVPDRTANDQGRSGTDWDDLSYRAILQAMMDAEERGELFRAKLALAIHLLKWNYAVDGDDLGELLDDRGVGWIQADLAGVLRELASAHLGLGAGPPDDAPRYVFDMRKDEILRLINNAASRLVGLARRESRPT